MRTRRSCIPSLNDSAIKAKTIADSATRGSLCSITTPLHSLQESSPPAESTSGAVEARIQLHATQLQNDQQSHKGLPTLPLQLVQLFWYRFRTYLDERHAPLELVIIEGKVVELHQLFFIVGALGGWLAVSFWTSFVTLFTRLIKVRNRLGRSSYGPLWEPGSGFWTPTEKTHRSLG